MKSIIFLSAWLLIACNVHAQTTPAKPATKTTATTKKAPAKKGVATKGKKTSIKKIKTSGGDTEFEELICYEDGPCTFNMLRGDTLVYEVNTTGKQYNFMVIPNKFDAATVADFSWIATAPESRAGHVVVSSAALNNSKRYMPYLPAGELKLSDASSVWFTNANFKEITKGQTTITLDNGQSETFSSPDADAVTAPVNYKGKQLNLEGFSMQNKPEGEAGRKEIWVMNISNNLLILKMDNGGWSMQLKEVREKKLKK